MEARDRDVLGEISVSTEKRRRGEDICVHYIQNNKLVSLFKID